MPDDMTPQDSKGSGLGPPSGTGPTDAPGPSEAGAGAPVPSGGNTKEIYDLAPPEPTGKTSAPARGSKVGIPPSGRGGERKGTIDKEKLLHGFDKDADFDRDPEVERARGKGGTGRTQAGSDDGTDEPHEGASFVQHAIGTSKVWLAGGGVILVGAVVAAAVTQKDHPLLSAMLVLYNGFLHTGTGIAAVGVAAVTAGRRLGPIDVSASRMLAGVAALLLLTNCNIVVIGTTNYGGLALGALAYAAVIAWAFRVWGQALVTVIGAHFTFWVIVQVGMELTAAVGRSAATAAAAHR